MQDKNEIFERKAPEILSELAKHVEVKIMSTMAANDELTEDKARQIGVDVARYISEVWGGEVIYIPRNLALMISERDYHIWEEFDGKNHRELARKYNVSMQWVYQIVRKIRKKEVAKRQGKLFNEG